MNTDSEPASTSSGGARVFLNLDDDEPNDFHAHHQLRVVDRGWIVQPKHSIFVGPESVIVHADVDSLREAMLQQRCCARLPNSPEWVAIALDNGEDFHPDSTPRDKVHLLVDTARVTAVAEVTVRREPQWTSAKLQELLQPAATPHGCVVDRVEYLVDGVDPDDDLADLADSAEFADLAAEVREGRRTSPHQIQVMVRHDGPTTVRVLLTAGRDVQAMLEALKDGPLNVRTAQNLLRAGLPHLLLGLPDSAWLEVKSRAYGLATAGDAGTRQKIELAQDVARFANGTCDAMLVRGSRRPKEPAQPDSGASDRCHWLNSMSTATATRSTTA